MLREWILFSIHIVTHLGWGVEGGGGVKWTPLHMVIQGVRLTEALHVEAAPHRAQALSLHEREESKVEEPLPNLCILWHSSLARTNHTVLPNWMEVGKVWEHIDIWRATNISETPGIFKVTARKTGGRWFMSHTAAKYIFLKWKTHYILGLLRILQ